MRRLGVAVLLAASLGANLGGCKLIDQRTFEGAAKPPSAADAAGASLPQVPLLTLRFDNPDFDIQPAVNEAVEAAQSRKPDVQFDVIAPVPTNATPRVQELFTQLGQEDTAKVVSALGYAGASLDHVHVGFRGDPGSPPREVMVFVH